MLPEKNKERVPIKSLRTYQGDVEEAIAKNNFSNTNILVAEQKRKEFSPEKVISNNTASYNPTRNKLFIYIGGLLFIIGALAVGSVYYIKSNEQTVVEQKTKTLLAFSKEKEINIASSTRETLTSNLKQERDSFKLPVNSVLYIRTLSGNVDAKTETLMKKLAPTQPSSLTRAFDNIYMLGVYSYDTNEIFMIIKIKDFPSAYSGMLRWESDMSKDLAKIYSITPETQALESGWSDQSLKNKDLRVLKDFNGKTQLLYSFVDKETLVIAKNESLFGAIIGKLAISKQSR